MPSRLAQPFGADHILTYSRARPANAQSPPQLLGRLAVPITRLAEPVFAIEVDVEHAPAARIPASESSTALHWLGS